MRKILRLLTIEECNRTCKLCCNLQFDLPAIPECESYTGYDMVVLTGGEPMLLGYDVLKSIIEDVRSQTSVPVVMYTAWKHGEHELADVIDLLDGLTLTLHTRKDVEPFLRLNAILKERGLWRVASKTLRLTVFDGIHLPNDVDLSLWDTKTGIKWLKECPLPEEEVFLHIKKGKYFDYSLDGKFTAMLKGI